MTAPEALPQHVEATVRAIAELHAEHHKRATQWQRYVELATARAGRPSFLGVLTLVLAAWILLNVGLIAEGREALDPPPFSWLQGAVAVAALYMTILILTTQRREDQLAERREQLTLELAILSEQKAAKIIELLEELRQDDPHLPNRVDGHAAALAISADPQAVLSAIDGSHRDLSSGPNR